MMNGREKQQHACINCYYNVITVIMLLSRFNMFMADLMFMAQDNYMTKFIYIYISYTHHTNTII